MANLSVPRDQDAAGAGANDCDDRVESAYKEDAGGGRDGVSRYGPNVGLRAWWRRWRSLMSFSILPVFCDSGPLIYHYLHRKKPFKNRAKPITVPPLRYRLEN